VSYTQRGRKAGLRLERRNVKSTTLGRQLQHRELRVQQINNTHSLRVSEFTGLDYWTHHNMVFYPICARII